MVAGGGAVWSAPGHCGVGRLSEASSGATKERCGVGHRRREGALERVDVGQKGPEVIDGADEILEVCAAELSNGPISASRSHAMPLWSSSTLDGQPWMASCTRGGALRQGMGTGAAELADRLQGPMATTLGRRAALLVSDPGTGRLRRAAGSEVVAARARSPSGAGTGGGVDG